ncbi:hypothetical protein [Nostoc sp.]
MDVLHTPWWDCHLFDIFSFSAGYWAFQAECRSFQQRPTDSI